MSSAPLSEGALPPWDCSVVHFASDLQHTDVLLRCSHMIGDGQLFMQLLRGVLEEVDPEIADDEGVVLEELGSDDSSSSGAGGSGSGRDSGGSGRTGGSGCGTGSPTLIQAVRSQSAFLPPPSLERSQKKGGTKGPGHGRDSVQLTARKGRRRGAANPVIK
jgi:hypothetical protein